MSDYFIISFISHAWEMYPRVPHYTAMSKYAKVLCVELPLTIFDVVFRPRKIWKQRPKIKDRLRQINKNLFIYTPIAVVPFGLSYRSKLLGRLNRLLIAHGLKKILNHLYIQKYIYIIHSPFMMCLADILNPITRVYEVVDEWAVSSQKHSNYKSNPVAKTVEREERKILSAADIVFATSKKLYEKKRQYNRNTYFIPNGVYLEHFLSSNNKKFPDIMAISHPRIGYVGHITTFLNFEWLDYCAVEHPEWSFIFLGIVDFQKVLNQDPNFIQFKKRKNVFMLGWKKYEDLPAYMKEIDVFILPRRDCDWCENSNPNKIYQYLSTGKPIVSSRFNSVEPFEGPIFIADNKLAFLKHLEKAIYENDSELKEQRLKLARQNDLSVRAKEKIDILNTYLTKNQKLK